MASAEELQRELDTIRRERREEDKQWRIKTSEKLNSISESQSATHSMMKEVKADVSGLRTAVHGPNGKPNEGLEGRVGKIEEAQASQTWFNRAMNYYRICGVKTDVL